MAGHPLVQLGLHGLERVAIQNGRLLAVEDLAFEGDLADVEAVTEEMGKRTTGEGNAANRFALGSTMSSKRQWSRRRIQRLWRLR